MPQTGKAATELFRGGVLLEIAKPTSLEIPHDHNKCLSHFWVTCVRQIIISRIRIQKGTIISLKPH